MSSPTQRSLANQRESGAIPWIVEKTVPFKFIKIDLYNIIDLVSISAEIKGVLGIQVTSGSNVSARIKKAMANEYLPVWLSGGNRFVVEGWRKVGPRGKRKLWALRAVEIVLIDGKMEVKELCKSDDGENETTSESLSETESENS